MIVISIWAIAAIAILLPSLAVLMYGLGKHDGRKIGFEEGAAAYEHHLKYPVTESHRHYPAGPWDQYRPPQ